MDQQAQLVLDAQNSLGESPLWDEQTSSLFWVDILQKKIFVHHTLNGSTETHDIGQYIGSISLQKDGKLICALQNGFHEYDRINGELRFIANPENHLPGNRFNDGKCDGYGRFWAGTMAMGDQSGAGALYCLKPNYSVERVLEDITCSNGLCWTGDHTTMYYIDSPTKEVWAFDFDAATGTLSGKRVVVRIPDGEGIPDGMTIDSEGMIWVAHWGGWQVSRWNPATGRKLGRIRVPAGQVTSCTFGGVTGDELWITTARSGIDEVVLSNLQPLAGGVFRAKVNVRGLPCFRFG